MGQSNGRPIAASPEYPRAERRSGVDRRRCADPTFDPRRERRARINRRRGGDASLEHGPDTAVERFVFDQLPYALLVLSRTGLVLTANRAASKMLSLQFDAPARCCDVLGCRNAAGALKNMCLTELLATAAPGQTPIRTDRPGQYPGTRSPLTVVPVAQDGARIVVRLYEDKPKDPLHAIASRAVPAATLRISTLGRTRLQTDEGPLDGAWLEQRAGEVLQYLACERVRWVLTDEIAEAIWPNARSSSVDNVRFVIYDLRRRLEPGRPHRGRSLFIASGKGRYRLDTSHVTVDADEFERAVDDGIEAFFAGRAGSSIERLDHALDLYKGDFLADAPYATWAILERARLYGLATKALRLRADLARNAGDVNGLLACLERLGTMEPFDMDVHRQWLTVCLELSRYGEASRHYADLQRRMRAEFGERPPFELTDLMQQRHQLALV